jgi:hypothetical protein
MNSVPLVVQRWLAGVAVALLYAGASAESNEAAPPQDTNRDGRWLRQLCASDEPADVSVCNAYTLGIFDSLARWGPLPKCMPAGVTDKQTLSIVVTYLRSRSEDDLLLPADLLVTKALSDVFACR